MALARGHEAPLGPVTPVSSLDLTQNAAENADYAGWSRGPGRGITSCMYSLAVLRWGAGGALDDLPLEHMSRLADMPEKRLMLAVLLDAIIQLRRPGSTGAAEAAAWIAGESGPDEPFSYRALCEGLGIDPAYLTRGVYAWARRESPRGSARILRRSQGRSLRVSVRRRGARAIAAR